MKYEGKAEVELQGIDSSAMTWKEIKTNGEGLTFDYGEVINNDSGWIDGWDMTWDEVWEACKQWMKKPKTTV